MKRAQFRLDSVAFGEALRVLRRIPDGTFHCCVSSPPYWRQRDYGHPKQLGLEATPGLFVKRLVRIMREVRRTLRDDGSLWLNLGDTAASQGCGGGGRFMAERGEGAWSARAQLKGFNKIPPGLKRKDIIGVPWLAAHALQADGWYLRSDIIWAKPNPQPESVKDRPTKAHEYVFLLTKSDSYYYNHTAIREPVTGNAHPRGHGVNPKAKANAAGSRQNASFSAATSGLLLEERNARDVWTIPSEPYDGAHYAVMPTELARRCILAGCPEGGAVLDPFIGSGTVGAVAERLGRHWFGIDLVEKDYGPLIAERTAQMGMFFDQPQGTNQEKAGDDRESGADRRSFGQSVIDFLGAAHV
jgi:DNA modification methylase